MGWISRIRRLLDTNLAQLEQAVPSRFVRLLIRNLRISIHVGRALLTGQYTDRAAALSYYSLLALVPLLAVVFSLFKAFGGVARVAEQAKSYLLDYIAEDSQGDVSQWLDRFVSSFNAAALGVVGMAALAVSLILTLGSVEDALNKTWAVRNRRPWGHRLVVYWTLLTVGPLLLGSSLAITAGVQSSSVVVWAHENIPLFRAFRPMLPMLFTCVAFSAMYLILPAARVRWSAALYGGLVASVMFELAKWLYTVYAARSLSNHTLYGSLAALPLFIVWINYSWRVVLFGADVAHAVQYLSTDPTEETDPRTNQATREEAAVRICAVIAAAFSRAEPPPTSWSISAQLLLPAHLTETLCQHLLAAGLIRDVAQGRREGGFVPARSLDALTVADIVKVMRHDVGMKQWSVATDARDVIDEVLLEVETTSMARLAKLDWKALAGDPAARAPLEEPVAEPAKKRRSRAT